MPSENAKNLRSFSNLTTTRDEVYISIAVTRLFFTVSLQIFSMVVFASIINEGYVNMGSERLHCVFNKNADACNYGITIGIVAFLACVFFLALDVYFPQISSVKDRKRAVLLEIVFSGKNTQSWIIVILWMTIISLFWCSHNYIQSVIFIFVHLWPLMTIQMSIWNIYLFS